MASELKNYLSLSLTHQGYMTGLRGEEPDSNLDRSEEYSQGWLAGAEDREKMPVGSKLPSYLGPTEDLPFKRGSEVVIPMGTQVESRGKVRSTRKAYKVKLDDVYQGVPAYVDYGHNGKVVRPTEATVLWAGAGGYWCRAKLSDLVKET